MSWLKIFLQVSQKLLQRLLEALELKRNHGFPTKSSIFAMKNENFSWFDPWRLIRMSGTPIKKDKENWIHNKGNAKKLKTTYR